MPADHLPSLALLCLHSALFLSDPETVLGLCAPTAPGLSRPPLRPGHFLEIGVGTEAPVSGHPRKGRMERAAGPNPYTPAPPGSTQPVSASLTRTPGPAEPGPPGLAVAVFLPDLQHHPRVGTSSAHLAALLLPLGLLLGSVQLGRSRSRCLSPSVARDLAQR